MTKTSDAEPNALEAVVRLIVRLPAFGQFRTRNEIGGPTFEARLSRAQGEKAQAFLDAPEFATLLRAELAEITLEAQKAAVQEQDRQRTLRLTPLEFGMLIEKRSAGRLQQKPRQAAKNPCLNDVWRQVM
ncbi:hypothetical protein [Roseateles albus]|uniref:Uncharacterized protein n=1 Tax=Roseateles albus TaxID=2987525 RepID=A0ABT5KFG4_9BURK|nr:hypothetical protein [Roseateles albus]MDC8771720.1 hypothetical protein [Roseateles albus]